MKTPLSPLSTVWPAKGEAARVEAAETPRPPQMPDRENRIPITVRILVDDNERLRLVAFEQSRTKQSLIDQAIAEFLARLGK